MNQSTEQAQKQDGEKYLTFFEHLEELRFRIFRCILAVLFSSILVAVFHKTLFQYLTKNVPDLYWHTPLEYWYTLVKIVVVTGIFIAFPYLVFELWRFVSPGLYTREKRFLLPFILSSWIMFILGAVFVYLVMLPLISTYLYQAGLIGAEAHLPTIEERVQTLELILLEQEKTKNSNPQSPQYHEQLEQLLRDVESAQSMKGNSAKISNFWSVARYINLSLTLFLAFGVAFDLPVVVVLLTQLGIVQPKTLAKARPVILVGVFVFAALLTPPDPLSQIMMGLPMYLLFELSIIISRVLQKMKRP